MTDESEWDVDGQEQEEAPDEPFVHRDQSLRQRMHHSAGFKKLNPDERSRLDILLVTRLSVGDGFEGNVSKLLTSGKAYDPKQWRRLLDKQPNLTPVERDRTARSRQKPLSFHKVDPAHKVNYVSAPERPSLRYRVRFGAAKGGWEGHTLMVYVPKQRTPDERAKWPNAITKEKIETVLSGVDPSARASITQVRCEPGNPEGIAGEVPHFRSTQISLFPQAQGFDGSDKFMTETFEHESGHVIMDRMVSDIGWEGWKRAMDADDLSLSKYAQSNRDEDFAESWAQFVQVRDNSTQRAQMAKLVPHRWAILTDVYSRYHRDHQVRKG